MFYARGCVLHPCFFVPGATAPDATNGGVFVSQLQTIRSMKRSAIRKSASSALTALSWASCTLAAALEIAEGKDLDLVKIAPGSNPPVCRIMDYGKYRFEQAKREKEARKNQHVIEVKEIRMSPGIGENDFNTKLKNGQKFLQGGDRLKVTIRFRGREMAHTNIGEQLLRDFAAKCADIANLDKQPKLEGRNMSMFLSPKPQNTNNKK